jgi:sulfoxide reductase heme-binding subunit YedZ
VTWYLARATGLVLLVVFTASTALGVVSATTRSGGRVPRFVSTDLHRRLSLLAVVLLAAHIAVSIADSYVSIGALDALVPFVGSYRATWLGLGTLATDLILAVAVTSALRHRMPPLAWRAVHLSVYASWPAVVLHGLGTGSDTRRAPVLVLTATCTLVVLAAAGWRLVAGRPSPLGLPRMAGLAALPILAFVLVVWTMGGPLASGWAKRSGTPPAPTHTLPAAAQVGAR